MHCHSNIKRHSLLGAPLISQCFSLKKVVPDWVELLYRLSEPFQVSAETKADEFRVPIHDVRVTFHLAGTHSQSLTCHLHGNGDISAEEVKESTVVMCFHSFLDQRPEERKHPPPSVIIWYRKHLFLVLVDNDQLKISIRVDRCYKPQPLVIGKWIDQCSFILESFWSIKKI